MSVLTPALVSPYAPREASRDPGWLLREAGRKAKCNPRNWAHIEDGKVNELLEILPKMVDDATTRWAATRREMKAARLANTSTKKRHVELLERIDRIERLYGRRVTDEEIRRWAQNQIVGRDYGEVFSGRVISSQVEADIASSALPPGATSTFLTNAALSHSGRLPAAAPEATPDQALESSIGESEAPSISAEELSQQLEPKPRG